MNDNSQEVLYPQAGGNTNNLENDMNDLSINNLSTIQKATSTQNNSTINFYYQILTKKEKIFPYPSDVEEIPVIKFKDEKTSLPNEKNKLSEPYDDSKFNTCKKCKKNYNTFFCEKCQENICFECNCSKECDKSSLIKLKDEEEKIQKYKEEINKLIYRYFIKPKEKEKNPNEKNNKNYNGSIEDDNEMNEQNNTQSFLSISDDIILIKAINVKNYNNYFHFKNIKASYEYLKNRYEGSFDNNCLGIEYNVEDLKGKIKIFGRKFVNNNKDKLFLIINNKKTELIETIDNKDSYLEVILVQKTTEQNNYIENMSYMFCGCESNSIKFKKIKNRKLLDLNNVNDISGLFKNCTHLREIDLTIFKNMTKVKKMNSLFSGCEELTTISKLEYLYTGNVTTMANMFNSCEKLNNLKALEGNNFNTNNVKSFENMFRNCCFLKELNISHWNMKNAKCLKGMFKDCIRLKSLPNISEWNVENVRSMERMFFNCKNLENLDDLKKWNLKSLENVDGMFYNCRRICSYKGYKIQDLINIDEEISDNVFDDN